MAETRHWLAHYDADVPPSAELPNAVAAVARELAGFLWAVMQDESAAQRL